jgi:hypothetical protein
MALCANSADKSDSFLKTSKAKEAKPLSVLCGTSIKMVKMMLNDAAFYAAAGFEEAFSCRKRN